MAQLVARLVRNEKVGGSNPPSSTTDRYPIVDVGFSYVRAWYRPGFVYCKAGVGVPVGLCAGGVTFRGYRTKRVGFSAFWCGKIGIEVGGSQLEGWTKRVGFVATFRLAGAGKSTLKLVVSSWGYEYPQMSGVRASDDQVWALSVRGTAMALLPV